MYSMRLGGGVTKKQMPPAFPEARYSCAKQGVCARRDQNCQKKRVGR